MGASGRLTTLNLTERFFDLDNTSHEKFKSAIFSGTRSFFIYILFKFSGPKHIPHTVTYLH